MVGRVGEIGAETIQERRAVGVGRENQARDSTAVGRVGEIGAETIRKRRAVELGAKIKPETLLQ